MKAGKNNGQLSRLRAENDQLRNRLTEAEQALRAIGRGDADTVVVDGPRGRRVYSLEEAENLYRRLAETVREPMLALNADGVIVFFNECLRELLGLSSEEIAGRKMSDLICAGDRSRFRMLLRRARKPGSSQACARLVAVHGGDVPVYWMANALERQDGKLICLVGTDLTRQELSEQTIRSLDEQRRELIAVQSELELSRQRYANLYDFAPVGYLTLGRSGCIHEINVTAAHMLGHPREKLSQTPLVVHIAAADRRKFLNHLSLCRRLGKRTSTELRLDSSRRNPPVYVELISLPFVGDAGMEFKSVITDITVRREATEALRESEERFHNMADNAPVLIWISDRDKRHTYFNKPWLDFTGRTLKQELGNGWRERVHADDRRRCLKTYTQAFDARGEFKMEYRLRRHDGKFHWVLDHGVPHYSPAKEFLGYIGSCIDITERKQIESAIEMTSRFPRENPAPVIRLDQGRIVNFANPAARAVLRRWGVGLGEEAPRSITRLARRALAGNKRQTCDVLVGNRQYQAWFAPLRKPGYVNLYFSDITERKQAEESLRRAHHELEARVRQRTRELTRANAILQAEITERKKVDQALRESEERLRLMIEGTRDYAIFMLDTRGRVASWNAGAEQITGYRLSEILGRHYSCFHTPEDVRSGKLRRLLKAARATGRAEDEGWRIRKDGSHYWASSIITALYDARHRLRGFLKVTRDISEWRQAREVLRLSEKNLADLFDHSPFGLLWVSPRGRIHRVNKAGLQLFGCISEECLNQPLQEYFADPKLAVDSFKRLGRREVMHNLRTQLRRKDGKIRHVLIDANGLWEQGRLVHTRWFLRDITRRVELEREVLVVAESERQHIGQELHDDLCQQLTGIEFLSQTLAGQLSARSPADADRARELARMIRRAINRTRELAHGLSPMELETQGLPGALRELADRAQKTFQITCRFQSKTAGLHHDPALGIHLYRIAQEAVANAIKHGRAKRVDIRLTRNRRRLVLTVRDNGSGLPQARRKSAGMGLRVMQHRAGVIDGTLEFQRNASGGTTVKCSVGNAFANGASQTIA